MFKHNGRADYYELCYKEANGNFKERCEVVSDNHDSLNYFYGSESHNFLYGEMYIFFIRTFGCDFKCFQNSVDFQKQTELDTVKIGNNLTVARKSTEITITFNNIYLPKPLYEKIEIRCVVKGTDKAVNDPCKIGSSETVCCCTGLEESTEYVLSVLTTKTFLNQQILS